MSNPKSPNYGQYLTPTEFAAKYGASQADFDAVLAWAKASGLNVTETSTSRNVIAISTNAAQLQSVFGIKFYNYTDANGRVFYSASSAPKMPASIASAILFHLRAFQLLRRRTGEHPIDSRHAQPAEQRFCRRDMLRQRLQASFP